MVVADAVADKDKTHPVVLAAPASAIATRANLPGLIHFRVGVGFVLAFVPSPAAKDACPIGKSLFEVDTEAVLHRSLQRMIGDFGNGCGGIREPGIYRIAIIAHIGVIYVGEQAQDT